MGFARSAGSAEPSRERNGSAGLIRPLERFGLFN